MSDPAAPLPCGGSAHLDIIVAEIDLLTGLLHSAIDAADSEAITRRRTVEDTATIEATLLLDGALRTTATGDTERAGTWLDALGTTVAAAAADDGGTTGSEVDEATLRTMAAAERAGATAGVGADDLCTAFGSANADASGLGAALGVLHGRMTTALVAADRAGRLRRGPRVVHDASVGRVLYFPTDPEQLPDAWDALLRNLTGSGAAAHLPAAVRAALLHLELLRHQPFDAANGRVARAAGRLAALADDLLPSGLGAPDAILAADPLGYHEEVAASMRRRDATGWVERVLEAQGVALRLAVDAVDAVVAASSEPPVRPARPAGPARPARPVSRVDRPGTVLPDALQATFTLGDVSVLLDIDTTTAREHCSEWVVRGDVRRVPGSSGLRLERTMPCSATT